MINKNNKQKKRKEKKRNNETIKNVTRNWELALVNTSNASSLYCFQTLFRARLCLQFLFRNYLRDKLCSTQHFSWTNTFTISLAAMVERH